MDIFVKLEKNKKFMEKYNSFKKKKQEKEKKRRVKGTYQFIDRKKDSENLCIILAGYKKILWDDIFERITKFAPKDMDVCIVSSGLYDEQLNTIAEKNNWSYLSLKQNKVTLVQNIAIDLHPRAKMIYKIDEDIFITKNFFSQLMETYNRVEKESHYRIGFVAPLLPINGYSNVNVLEKTGTLEKFEERFGKAYHDGGGEEKIIKNPDIAKFMWGETEERLRNLDKLSDEFSKEEFTYSICPIRFSIGAILFSREIWEAMGRFVVERGANMGRDEAQMCEYCMIESRAIVISENTIAGHFSYGPQTKTMEEFYTKNREIFKLL